MTRILLEEGCASGIFYFSWHFYADYADHADLLVLTIVEILTNLTFWQFYWRIFQCCSCYHEYLYEPISNIDISYSAFLLTHAHFYPAFLFFGDALRMKNITGALADESRLGYFMLAFAEVWGTNSRGMRTLISFSSLSITLTIGSLVLSW